MGQHLDPPNENDKIRTEDWGSLARSRGASSDSLFTKIQLFVIRDQDLRVQMHWKNLKIIQQCLQLFGEWSQQFVNNELHFTNKNQCLFSLRWVMYQCNAKLKVQLFVHYLTCSVMDQWLIIIINTG